MKATLFKETNHIFGAGENPNTTDLPVCISLAPQYSEGHNVPFIVSRWKVSQEEIEKINETGEIWISIMGASMSPIMPLAFHPFKELGFKPIEKK